MTFYNRKHTRPKFYSILASLVLASVTAKTSVRNIEIIFRKHSIEMLQYCKIIYKAFRKVSKILQEPCNVRLKHYKWNIDAILIFHFHIAVM